jgi:hypothetical protein
MTKFKKAIMHRVKAAKAAKVAIDPMGASNDPDQGPSDD